MARQSINVGAAPNDGSGDNLRNAFIKVNDNFVEVYSLGIKGDKGDKGDQGDQGIQGIQGDKGDQGDQGIQGIQGDKGDQGDQGIQGEKGGLGDRGWSPVLVLETYTLAGVSRSVQKLSDYIGGTGDKPTANLGLYLKGDGTFGADRDLASNLKGADAIELAELNNKAAGNILRGDGVKFRSISEVEFLRPKLPHSKSPLGMALGYSFIENWGNTGENQTYKGDPYVLLDGFKSFDIQNVSFRVNMTFITGASDASNNFYVALMKDADNYLEININRSTVNFSKVISGVKTNLLSQSQPIGILRGDVRSFELKIKKDGSGTGNWIFTAFGSTVNATLSNGISEITDSENYTKVGFKSVVSGDADFIIYK